MTMAWQPIETAPRDGTVILLRGKDGGAAEGSWTIWAGAHKERDKDPNWYEAPEPDMLISALAGFGHKAPTHWAPLPEPPQ